MFETARIRFRKMTLDDVPRYHQWRNDKEVMEMTNPYLDVYTLDETRQFVEQVILGATNAINYMIEDKESGEAIGVTAVIQVDPRHHHGECIIDIGEKSFWGKGYVTDAMELLLQIAFLERNLHRVSLRVFSFNERAIHLYKKLGFTQEGVARESLYRGGKWHDIISMGLLRREYKEQRGLNE